MLSSWFSSCRRRNASLSRAPIIANQAWAVSATIESWASASAAASASVRRSIAWNSLRSEPNRSISQLASKPARQVSVRMPPGARGSPELYCAFCRSPDAVTVGNHE
jgi:hypothetical protein